MDKNISYRRAEVGDIEQIKEILFGSLQEYEIAIPDNYSVSDIDNLHHQNLKRQYHYIENMDFLICWKSKKHLVMTLHLKKY